MDDLLLIGRVGSRRTAIAGRSSSIRDRLPGRALQAGQHVLLVGPRRGLERRTIREVRFHRGRPIVGFEGVETMDAAEALAGAELQVPSASVGPLPDGTYYHHELVGCEVRSTRRARGSGGSRPSKGRWSEPAGRERRPQRGADPAGRADLREDRPRQARQIVVDPPEGLHRTERAGDERCVKIDIVTIFPKMVEAPLAEGIVGRAIGRGMLDVAVHDLRDFATDRHRVVDDMPFGGGPGMVLKPEPLFARRRAHSRRSAGVAGRGPADDARWRAVHARDGGAVERSRSHVVILCGRYEGVDDRVRQHLATEEISIGDYVLSGGELPALVIVDAVARLVPGVVGDEASVARDTFARGLLDFPQYTRPAEFRGLAVPAVLLSGHHAEIERWRRRRRWRERSTAGRTCWTTATLEPRRPGCWWSC